MQINRRIVFGAIAGLTFCALGGYAAVRYAHERPVSQAPQATGAQTSRADAAAGQYVCPMHPEVVQGHAGECPICGMDLVKRADAASGEHRHAVHVDAQMQERMGVRLQSASYVRLDRPIHAYATIAVDGSGSVSVNPKVDGWIKRLHIQGIGQRVHKGQRLYELYSPELQQRQREYVDLLTRREALLDSSSGMGGPNSAMLGSLAKERFRARDRLLAADVPLAVIEQLEKSRRIVDVVPVHAERDGIVTTVSAGEGAYVNPMQQILTYADTSRAWAEVTLFPDQLGWIREGDELVLTSTLDKSKTITARVQRAALQIDQATRTAKLRLQLNNASGAFLPGSQADVVIRTGARRALTVPQDAVIRTGHGDFVVVSEGNGHFRSARVTTGIENDQAVEIADGIAEGAMVAVNGQFLLDAASSMQAMQGRLAKPAAVPVAAVATVAGQGRATGTQHAGAHGAAHDSTHHAAHHAANNAAHNVTHKAAHKAAHVNPHDAGHAAGHGAEHGAGHDAGHGS